MKARPTKMKLRNMSEQTAKRLALALGAVLLVLILVIALFPLLDSVGKPYEVTTYAMGSYVQQLVCRRLLGILRERQADASKKQPQQKMEP